MPGGLPAWRTPLQASSPQYRPPLPASASLDTATGPIPCAGALGAHAAAAACPAAGHADGAPLPPHAAAVSIWGGGGQQPAHVAPPGHHARAQRHRGALGSARRACRWAGLQREARRGRRTRAACAGPSTLALPAVRTPPSSQCSHLPSAPPLPRLPVSLQDLLLPEEGLGFTTLRCPLRDVEEEDITPHLPGEPKAPGASQTLAAPQQLAHWLPKDCGLGWPGAGRSFKRRRKVFFQPPHVGTHD